MIIHAESNGRVHCQATIPLALSIGSAWGQLRDFRRYASHDYFHAAIHVSGIPRQGAHLRLLHRYGCFHVERIGRILRWREGEGFAFSDLSHRGPRSGFPHMLSLRLEPMGDNRSLLHIAVRGQWTTRWIPIVVRRLWLGWVFAYIVSRTRNELMAYQIAREIRRRTS